MTKTAAVLTRIAVLIVLLLTCACPLFADGLAGDWSGALGLSPPLHIVFHIAAKSGSYMVTLDCPEQTTFGLPTGGVSDTDGKITIPVPSVPGTFSGLLGADGKTITGSWSQGGYVTPLVLTETVSKPVEPAPRELIGTWFGTIAASGSFLLVVAHFQSQPDGSTSVALDTPEQNCYGTAGGTVTKSGATISVPVPMIHGIFRGTLTNDGDTLAGDWTQSGQTNALSLARLQAPRAVLPKTLDGAWSGTLKCSTTALQLIVHFDPEPNGAVLFTLDSPDQGASNIPGGVVTETNETVTLESSILKAAYVARLSADGTKLVGHWTQSGSTFPLTLNRSVGPVSIRPRPQTPQPPFPYTVKQITFPSQQTGVTLAGTLTLPTTAKNVPGVVLISGSGPNDRNEEFFRHQPFAVIADYLTRRGFAVLRYDKRGVGQSTGSYSTATIQDFADDAQAALSYLKTVQGVDPKRIGLIGHSEGGEIAPMVASRDTDAAFVVMLAGPAVPGLQVLLRQYVLIDQGEGVKPSSIATSMAYERGMLSLAMAGDSSESSKARILALYRKTYPGLAASANASILNAQIDVVTSPWFRSFLHYDPRPALTRLSVPVLALNGSKDRQVDPSQNLPAMRAQLARSKSTRHKVEELPGLNHMFQECETGAISEYPAIQETFSPAALKIIGDWLVSVTK